MSPRQTHRLARCWWLRRTDNFNLRLTDHDHKLTLEDGQIYTPMGGFDPSAIRKSSGLQEQNFDMRAALTSDAITYDDLRARRWDECEINEYVVDWLYPWSGSLQHRRYWITETTFDGERVTAGFSGIPYWLRFNVGPIVTRGCRDDLGGPTCKVSLPPLQDTCTVNVVENDRIQFTMNGARSTSDGFNNDGEILWLTGPNTGLVSQIRSYVNTPRRVRLHERTPFSISVGESFLLTPGCKKTIQGCHDDYGNELNFDGEPDVPGTDELVRVPTR